MNMNKYTPHNKTSLTQKENRKRLYELYENTPLPTDELLINTAMYTRSSALSKILFLDEIYKLIIDIPGNIHTYGVWWGQDVIGFQNLRAIHEPYNFNRKIVGFDTFTGYPEPSSSDVISDTIKEGAYSTSENYLNHLNELMDYHEQENMLSHIKKFEMVQGDLMETLPAYFERNPQEIIALMYIDIALYEPTKCLIDNCIPNLVKGSVLVFDELNAKEYPGETIALKESGLLNKSKIYRSKILPDRSILIYNP